MTHISHGERMQAKTIDRDNVRMLHCRHERTEVVAGQYIYITHSHRFPSLP